MAYLNQAVAQEMARVNRPVRLISLGAGYDTRLIRMLNDDVSGHVVECYEFDLTSSVESKTRLIQERLLKRQSKKGRSDLKLPSMIGLDLNHTEEFRKQLARICERRDDLHTIFVVEGVMMYLDKGNAETALQACADATFHSSLCFADRLFENFQVDPVPIQDGLRHLGWCLTEWAPAPNANAKHMGIARPIRTTE
jgi:O-methyltransferase involved in polyketide biosynthesis